MIFHLVFPFQMSKPMLIFELLRPIFWGKKEEKCFRTGHTLGGHVYVEPYS